MHCRTVAFGCRSKNCNANEAPVGTVSIYVQCIALSYGAALIAPTLQREHPDPNATYYHHFHAHHHGYLPTFLMLAYKIIL